MAMKLLNNNIADFWKEERTSNNCRISLQCLDGVSGADQIAVDTALL